MRTGRWVKMDREMVNIPVCMLAHYTKNAYNMMTETVPDRLCMLCVTVGGTQASLSSHIEGRMEAATNGNGDKIQPQYGKMPKASTVS
jgi:hypothetical protein